ncbi:MAG: hypothetical protein A3F73_11600 [Gallionellales bacterium RIFCSPLOWO2_12_FULL_59_22]|nr:MAG: hypothetical protein A3H99_07440 [Gallionellales bacterium RIFCSPLOWO2_02_FULL_59_110]OGT14830.1 MAG: hypothetical protein A3F73_11600 [Gallionellales bacterium RIFCSPLOWO2_12_FULL_59_22]
MSDDEIDELDVVLTSETMPDDCMDISTLDGYFAALALNPRLVMPSEYLPWIWDMGQGEEAPEFASLEQANHILQLLMRYYNSVLSAIGNGNFAPLFYTVAQDDGSEFFDAECWCEGFMRGVFLFDGPWKEVLEKHPEYLAPMVLLGTEHGWDMLEKCADEERVVREAYESIAGVVALLYEHFGEQREGETRKRLAQPGRHPSGLPGDVVGMHHGRFKAGCDEECPCGSGKKLEECCGTPPTVH